MAFFDPTIITRRNVLRLDVFEKLISFLIFDPERPSRLVARSFAGSSIIAGSTGYDLRFHVVGSMETSVSHTVIAAYRPEPDRG